MDSFLSNTVGVLWRGATGTVDPWSKNAQIKEEAAAIIQAGGDTSTAEAQARIDVTGALVAQKADPSQATILSAGLKDVLIWGVIILVAYGFITGFAQRKGATV